MKNEDAVETLKLKLKELETQNAAVVQAYDAYQEDRKAIQRTMEIIAKDARRLPPPRPAHLRPQADAAPPPSIPSAPQPVPRGPATPHLEYGGLIEAIREFAKAATGPFSTKEAEEFLRSQHPEIHAKLKPGALSGTFFKLREAGAIKLVEKGSGRKPSTYVKP